MPDGLKKKQLEALVDRDERESRRRRNEKRYRCGRGDSGSGTGKSASRGLRDAVVRALRKVLAERQRKASAKPPGAPAANADSSSPSDIEDSECTATIAEMAKMLADLESKMGPSHPASMLLRTQLEKAKKQRDGASPFLEKIQAVEKCLTTRQKAVEASTAKRDQL